MRTLTDESLRPVAPVERIQALDVVRGFALLGILLMNIEAFNGTLVSAITGVDPALTGADRWVDAAIYVLVQGKFYTLFSLLFGMGFAIMLDRAAHAGREGFALYARRILALFGFGLVHMLLIWSGDILLIYALFGFVLLLGFRRTRGASLLRWGVGLYLVPLLLSWGFALSVDLAQNDPQASAEVSGSLQEQAARFAELDAGQAAAYGPDGTYAEAVRQRVEDMGFMFGFIVFYGAGILGLFVLGTWFVRSGILHNLAMHRPFFRKLCLAGFLLGLPLALIGVALVPTVDMARVDYRAAAGQTATLLGNLLLCLAYFSTIVLMLGSPAWSRRLAVLAPTGRMALTNYLMQSIVCTLIFYGYGLGLFGQLPRAWQPAFVLALFALQVVVSRWWLARFRFGPAEWLWRALTYLSLPSMRAGTPGRQA